MQLTGNTILVTGGGTGIGRGLAEALHARGNKVIIAGRRASVLDETVAANPGMTSVVLDMANADDIASVAAQLIAEHPRLNMLVNSAGIALRDDASGVIDDELLVSTIAINVFGPIRLCSALSDHFKAQPSAAFVHVSSTLAYLPHAGCAVYSASKAALHSYILSQRYRARGTSISVIEIPPPMVATALDGNADNPRAMPLQAFIDETMAVMETGVEEVLTAQSRERRDRLRNDELGAMTAFNDMLSGAQ